ncbi:hypothetical protein [Glycomyces buryatensis]|uniref:Uncharacterized protein n=1 Tax=Glycomyces buryatensis TaxID=2570927 RepID=A0A4V4HSE8_9ACTN|nr:hypothetical protein [Glycomyces buryatensis]THV40516.1 hypothetical protein FAB82_14690 [Glycomyces buryatensis]
MGHRNFDPARDTPALAAATWLAPGERITGLYAQASGGPYFKVPRRRRNGDPAINRVLNAVLWILFLPIRIVIEILHALADTWDPADGTGTAGLIVFSTGPTGQAVGLADAIRGRQAAIILTDRRIAALELVSEGGPSPSQSFRDMLKEAKRDIAASENSPHVPTEIKPVGEVPAGHFRYEGRQSQKPRGCKKADYHRVVLADGSGFYLQIR